MVCSEQPDTIRRPAALGALAESSLLRPWSLLFADATVTRERLGPSEEWDGAFGADIGRPAGSSSRFSVSGSSFLTLKVAPWLVPLSEVRGHPAVQARDHC